jgi:hypothetical protein
MDKQNLAAVAILFCANLALSLPGCKEPDTDQTRNSKERRRSSVRENPSSSQNEGPQGPSGASAQGGSQSR